eukprot:2442775-Pyramimonas_sp.AAC.1
MSSPTHRLGGVVEALHKAGLQLREEGLERNPPLPNHHCQRPQDRRLHLRNTGALVLNREERRGPR